MNRKHPQVILSRKDENISDFCIFRTLCPNVFYVLVDFKYLNVTVKFVSLEITDFPVSSEIVYERKTLIVFIYLS